ncbi:MAG: hypothetical protein H6633_02130 [Anaerolineales bacterium]|nr:hypothetical protein [Anaerolineales bacterium]
MTKLKTEARPSSVLRVIIVALVLLLGAAAVDTYNANAAQPAGGGTIVIDKITDPSGDPQSFTFTLHLLDGTTQEFNLTDADDPVSVDVPAGNGYEVSENIPDGWTQTGSECTSDTRPGNPSTASNIKLQDGETVTCTFTNTKSPTPTDTPTNTPVPPTATPEPVTLILVKDAQPDSSQSFNFDVTGPDFNNSYTLTDDGTNNNNSVTISGLTADVLYRAGSIIAGWLDLRIHPV